MAYARCQKCECRKTLPRPPGHYRTAPPKCPRCGHRGWRVDKYRQRVERGPKAKTCHCYRNPMLGGVYWFPHRKGSLGCAHNPALTSEVAEKLTIRLGLTR